MSADSDPWAAWGQYAQELSSAPEVTRTCQHCGRSITCVLGIWLATDHADVDGICKANPHSDRHQPEGK